MNQILRIMQDFRHPQDYPNAYIHIQIYIYIYVDLYMYVYIYIQTDR